ncbi:inducible alternative oxidase 2 [Sporothrix bragantina]|uniref:Alternative oxidase n=1 Tax=Sporothrix bragantina TaxID=671064 RepID=A0ABP0BJV2_9PEZI
MTTVRLTSSALSQSQLVSRQLARAAIPVFCSSQTSLHKLSPSLHRTGSSVSSFSTTTSARMRDFFPVQETEHIRQTPPAWPHHGFTEAEMLAVVPGHRAPETIGDKIAWRLMRICRWGMDTATGMKRDQKTDKSNPTTAVAAEKPLTEAQWMIRFIFLESIAGVPGMVAGMLRHLHSIRRLKRDNGWIESLLEESYNERMHLLTFMKMCEPGWFMKLMILGAQGVYFNTMFLCYLVSPRACHRFVGYLEEEAVHTYTRCLAEIDAGHTPAWTDPNFKVPEIAVRYWNMPEDKRTMRDLILYIRADEAGHRGVNHTLGNLDQKNDPNPFVSEYKGDRHSPSPLTRPAGYERNEVM